MEQFNLEEYKKNPNRKVVTRRGNPVRIICTDRKHGEDDLPIVFLEECSDGGEFLFACKSDGTADYHYATMYDLFFAYEKNELTEFEKELEMMMVSFSNGNLGSDVRKEMPKQKLHIYANRLLDLARKEIEKEDWRPSLRAYKNGYEQGKQDVLKGLPNFESNYIENLCALK